MASNSLDELNTRLADLRLRHDEAQEAAHAARDERGRIAGLRVLGEVDAEALSVASGTLQAAETAASDLASAVVLLEARLASAATEAAEAAAGALRGKGQRAVAAREAALTDMKEGLAAAAAAIERFDKCNAKVDSLRAEAIDQFRADEKMQAADEQIRSMIDAAPAGQVLNPLVADREHQRATDAIQAGVLAAADEVAAAAGDELLRDVAEAVGLPAERLLARSLAAALGAGAEFVSAGRPPSVAGIPTAGQAVRRLYGTAELPMANQKYRDFLDALDRLAIDQPSIADSYRGSAGGSTVSSVAA